MLKLHYSHLQIIIKIQENTFTAFAFPYSLYKLIHFHRYTQASNSSKCLLPNHQPKPSPSLVPQVELVSLPLRTPSKPATTSTSSPERQPSSPHSNLNIPQPSISTKGISALSQISRKLSFPLQQAMRSM